MTVEDLIERSSKWETELCEQWKKETDAYKKAVIEGMVKALHTQRYDLYDLALQQKGGI